MVALVVIAYGGYQQIATSPFSDTCHVHIFPSDLSPIKVYFGKYNIP